MSDWKPDRAHTNARPGLTLFAMCLAAGMTFLEITATIGTLTAIQADLNVSPSTLIWAASSYTLPVAALILTAASLGGILGRKRVLALGIVVLTIGSLIVATAPTITFVLAGQAVAGVGAALILPNSLALLTVTFTDGHKRTEAIGLWAASSGIGLAAGPVIAGVLLEHFSWHSVFLANVVFGVVALAVTLPSVVESRHFGQRLDPAGLLLGTLAVSGVVYGAIEGGHRGYSDPLVIGAFVTATVTAFLFVVVELRTAPPMIQVRLFRSSSLTTVMVVAAVALFGFTGVTLLVVLFFQRVQGLTQLQTGLRLLPEMIAFVITSAVTARIVRRIGFTIPLAAGLTLAGLASLALLTAEPTSSYVGLASALAVFGTGLGVVVAASTTAAVTSVDPAQVPMTSGLVNTFRQVGSVLGTSVLGTILTSGAAAHLPGALTAHGVIGPEQREILVASANGSLSSQSLTAPSRAAVGDAFTSGLHTGLVVNASVFLTAAILAAVLVRHRQHTEQPVTQPADPIPSR